MARARRHEERHRKDRDKGRKSKGDHKGNGNGHNDPGTTPGKSATDDIKETATTGECPVITMNPTAAQMSVPPDEAANDLATYSTGPGEAVMYHYDRQGQYAEEFASQQAEQSAVPAGVSVAGPGGG